MRIHRVFSPAALRQARTDKGQSRAYLAAQAGISVHSVRDIESGYWTPGINTAAALADALDVPLDALVARETRPVAVAS